MAFMIVAAFCLMIYISFVEYVTGIIIRRKAGK